MLVVDPQDAAAHALLAHCLSGQGKHKEATDAACLAISVRPDLPVGYSALAAVHMRCGNLEDGASAIEHAIALDPSSVSDRGVQAVISLKQENWKATLRAADAGLSIDPGNVSCLNSRTLALARLGRLDDAITGNIGALHQNPESGLLHANQGWALLGSCKDDAAQAHFLESLRLDPNSRWAQLGLREAQRRAVKGPRPFLYPVSLWLIRIAHRLRMIK
jgi:tetratricopeptide (TPR) repeat protein